MRIPLGSPDKHYTYGDCKTWPEDERRELIEGTAWDMSPAPNRCHQEIFGELFRQIGNFLENNPCKVYAAPFDVLLPGPGEYKEDDVSTVVQPDISVICDAGKLTDKGCTGAPDWIIEILSPNTSKKDFSIKFNLYQNRGVKEYWIADPGNKYIHVYHLDYKGNYQKEPEVFIVGDSIERGVIKGLVIKLERVFKE